MKSGQYRVYLMIGGIVFVCLLILMPSSMLMGGEQTSRTRRPIRQEFTIPPAQTDMTIVVAAYERMMKQYGELIESAQRGLQTDVDSISRKLEEIDRKISLLSDQIEAIQKKLGIEPLEKKSEEVQNGLCIETPEPHKPGENELEAENH